MNIFFYYNDKNQTWGQEENLNKKEGVIKKGILP